MRSGPSLALAVLLSGCGFSVHSGVNPNVGLTSAPVRRIVVPTSFALYVAIKDAATAELHFPVTLGALGGKSEPVVGIGARVLTHSNGWRRPGYYGSFAFGDPISDQGVDDPDPPRGRMYRYSAGVVWTAIKPDSYGYWFHDAIATAGLGIVIHQQRQEGIGNGVFIGVELTVSLGASGLAALEAFTKED